MRAVLVTGAAGFVGRHTCRAFRASGFRVVAAVRGPAEHAGIDADVVVPVGDLASAPLPSLVEGVDCVVHLAGRAHRMSSNDSAEELGVYRAANRDVTRALATAARHAGVRRFVYVSSAKVMGEERDAPYRESDVPAPRDSYGLSKLEAESALHEVAAGGQMGAVVIRPPMVYGPGGKGNVPRLMRLVRLGAHLPLPFGAVQNRRSLIFVGNLADVLVRCATHDSAAGNTFFVSDGEDLSTPELLRRLGAAMGRQVLLVPVPPVVLRAGARALGRGADASRLLDSLVVDTTRIESLLDWKRPYSVDQGLRETARVAA